MTTNKITIYYLAIIIKIVLTTANSSFLQSYISKAVKTVVFQLTRIILLEWFKTRYYLQQHVCYFLGLGCAIQIIGNSVIRHIANIVLLAKGKQSIFFIEIG